MIPDDFDWRAEGQASAHALGLVIVLAVPVLLILTAALIAFVVGIVRAGLDAIGAGLIVLALAAVIWQLRGLVREEIARRRERVRP